jgi:predicted DNA-binding antitoxin AbrB/MazE fold protein
MSKRLEAVYENGVLRLLEPADLQEHQRVTVILDENGAAVTSEAGGDQQDPRCRPTGRNSWLGGRGKASSVHAPTLPKAWLTHARSAAKLKAGNADVSRHAPSRYRHPY